MAARQYEDMERLADSYDWWPHDTAIEGLQGVLHALHANHGSYLTVQVGKTAEGLSTAWICARDANGMVVMGMNDSFPCPPRCMVS